MDLDFNIQGCGLYKSWRRLKMLHFGTSLVYWASLLDLFLVHNTVSEVDAISTQAVPLGIVLPCFESSRKLINWLQYWFLHQVRASKAQRKTIWFVSEAGIKALATGTDIFQACGKLVSSPLRQPQLCKDRFAQRAGLWPRESLENPPSNSFSHQPSSDGSFIRLLSLQCPSKGSYWSTATKRAIGGLLSVTSILWRIPSAQLFQQITQPKVLKGQDPV